MRAISFVSIIHFLLLFGTLCICSLPLNDVYEHGRLFYNRVHAHECGMHAFVLWTHACARLFPLNVRLSVSCRCMDCVTGT